METNNYSCNSSILYDVDIILKKGWIKLKNNVTFKNDNKLETHEIILLSGIRQYYVDKLFNCTIKKITNTTKENSFYTAFGSTNIISDYDLTIISKKAPEIMKDMFLEFIKSRKSTLPNIFDTNLYCIGYFLSQGINTNFKNNIINIDDKMSSFQPINNNDKMTCLNYALIKLIEGNINIKNINDMDYLNKLIIKAKNLKDTLDNNLLVYNNKTKQNNEKYFSNIKSNDEKYILNKYLKTYDVGKKLFSILYNTNTNTNTNSKNLFELMCMTQYYSIEGYYTPCTVNVVVIEMQKGTDLKLDKFNYLISIIENLGDLNNHLQYKINTTNEKIKKLSLLNVSKYIYRIYYSLYKLDENISLKIKLNDIKNNIVSYRASGNITKAKFNLINTYNKNDSLSQFINKFNLYILKEINTLLQKHLQHLQ